MGWYGESNETCPNCKQQNAITQFRNSMNGPLYLICPDCGLKLYCDCVVYAIHSAYIDKDIIGKSKEDIENIDFTEDIEITGESFLTETHYCAGHQG